MNKEIKKMEYQEHRKMELLYDDIYKDYHYYILNLGTHPTAYVEIPEGHKLYGKDYFDIENIDVHGGLTYSRKQLMCIESKNWFIGWDYAHWDDYMTGLNEGKKWTTEEIIEDCKSVINQIINMED